MKINHISCIKKFLFLVFILFLIYPVLGLIVNIETKDFKSNERIYFNYSILSDSSQEIIFIPHVICPKAPIAFFQEKTIILSPNLPYNDVYYNIRVDDSIEPQICTAYIQVLSPIQQRVSKNFSIITNPSFSFELQICKSSSCSQKSKVFIQGENVYLNYKSSVENPLITAVLTYPDGKKENINLPGSIKSSQIGTYELEAIASKEGYKTQNVKEQFGVIEKPAEIKTVSAPPVSEYAVSNEEGKGKSALANVFENIKKSKTGLFIFWSFIVMLIIAITIITVNLLKKIKSR